MREEQRLSPLSETTEFRLRPDAPDVRGWPVEKRGGELVGRVTELLVDRAAARVRYIEITFEEPRGEAHGALVPIGLALVSRERDVIIVTELADADALSAANTEYEEADYTEARFDERRFLGERSPETSDDFSYLVGVGGAMTARDADPEVVGEVAAGQIRVPVIEEHTARPVAPEEARPVDLASIDEGSDDARRAGTRRDDDQRARP